jgi:hypothetical protein
VSGGISCFCDDQIWSGEAIAGLRDKNQLFNGKFPRAGNSTIENARGNSRRFEPATTERTWTLSAVKSRNNLAHSPPNASWQVTVVMLRPDCFFA